MLLSIEGPEKTGKTGLAYTAPLPIVGFQFDLGFNRSITGGLWDKYFHNLKIKEIHYNRLKPDNNLIEAHWTGNDITVYHLPAPIQIDTARVTGFFSLWNYFINILGLAINDPDIESIVLDTATIARSIRMQSHLEELNMHKGPNEQRKSLLQIEYGPINQTFENLYLVMAAVEKNFIAVHHTRPVYIEQLVNGIRQSVESGKFELDGWNKTYRFIDTALRLNRDLKNKETPFWSEIIECGDNPALIGTKLPNLDWNMLVDMISMSLNNRKEFSRR